MAQRLTEEGITIADVIKWSYQYYKSAAGDNKDQRMKIDVKHARFVAKNNYDYNHSTQQWEQVGRDIMFEFLVMSQPTSYKRIDTLNKHYYPVTLLIHNFDKGLRSTFRWRTGSLKKPVFSKKGDNANQRKKIAHKNIKNQIQLNFFFYLEFILQQRGLLYGRSWANRPPRKTNPRGIIFFDKTALYIIKKILIPLFRNKDFKLLIGKIYKG